MNSLKEFKAKYDLKLNSQQEEVVNHVDGPAVVLAVAGAGKTTSIVSRIGNLILNYGIAPEGIITMTFSKASAKDMKNRFDELFKNEIDYPLEFSTIHSFAYKIMYIYSKRTGTTYNLIEEDKENKEHDKISKYKILRQIALKHYNKHLSEDQLEELINTIGYVKNMMLKEDEFISHEITFPNFKEIYNSYENFKKENNLIDYDDMLTITYDILLNNPKLLEQLRRKYHYIQIDEAQDTSPIQFEIVKLLAYPKNNVVFVGDDDQSIYRFRGTNPELMLNFKQHFNGAKVFFMEQNFRSTKDIINLANPFIKENRNRYNKNIFTEKDKFTPPEVIYSHNEIAQVDFIIERLKEVSTEESNAIIFRNNLSAIYIMDQLYKHNLSFYIRDFKNKFFKHWIINDMLSFINVALDPFDIVSFSNIYYKTNGFLSKDIIVYTKQAMINNNRNIFDTMLTYPSLNDLQKVNIIKLKSNFTALKSASCDRFIRVIEYQLGYENFLKRQSKDKSNSNGNHMHILGIFKIITADIENIKDVKNKLQGLDFLLKKSSYNKEANITLTTAHSSKGLEYDNVFIVDIVEDIFPNYGSVKKAKDEKILDEIEEERRLMYVAITRAKKRLSLFSLNNKNSNSVDKSLFIKEIEKILNIKSELKTLHCSKGTNIKHNKFGIGKVKSVERNTALVSFISGDKYIDLDICAQNNLIRIIE